MSRRKRHEEEHPNHERWLVSYADFITLLFAFFVVMYSISSVNEGKYRVLSNSLSQVFSDDRGHPVEARSPDPIQIGELKRSQGTSQTLPDVIDIQGGQMNDEQNQMNKAVEQIERVMAPYIQDDMIAVKKENSWVEIEMKSALLFTSGSAELAPTAIPMIDKLADIFSPLDNLINVEGHTDDKPISTPQFPSNWELSSARAASVVRQLMKGGVKPERLAATGYGEHHPVAENLSEDGRFKNRRVVLILQSKTMARYQAQDDAHPLAAPIQVTSTPAPTPTSSDSMAKPHPAPLAPPPLPPKR